MNLKVNAFNPSFGMVKPDAITLAKIRGEKDIDELVDSQKDNCKYHINESVDYNMNASYGVEIHGQTIERFKSLAAACTFATATEITARKFGAL